MIWPPIRRGLVVGLLAGLLAGLFAFAVGEPLVQDAIEIEESAARAQAGLVVVPAHISDIAVSRDAQRGGLFLGHALLGVAMGGLLAVAFVVLRGRGRQRSDWQLVTTIASAAFVALALVPFVKYPANPPAVGDPDTIGERTALYVVLVVGAVLALVAAVRAGRSAERRGDEPWRRPVAVSLTFVLVAGALVGLLPDVDEVPPDFPPSLLWEFRLSSLGTQTVFWATLGIHFGVASDRAARRAATGAATA